MSGLEQLTTDAPPPEPPRSGWRLALAVLAAVAAVALLTVPIVLVHDLVRPSPAPPVAGPASAAAPTPEAARDTNDPMHPGGEVTLDPATRSDTEAAVVHDWPLRHHDEFDGTGLDPTFWRPYSGETTGGIGRHRPSNLSVSDGTLKITSHGHESAGMAWSPGQLYGRWEVRVKTQVGTGYGPVILLWPDAEDFPEGGEIDFMEIPKSERTESNFVLHSGPDNRQVGTAVRGDFTRWHNYAVEWAPGHVAGFIDGQEIFRTTDRGRIPPRPMHLAIQQDIGPYGKDWIPPLDDTSPEQVQLQVDWVRIYSL